MVSEYTYTVVTGTLSKRNEYEIVSFAKEHVVFTIDMDAVTRIDSQGLNILAGLVEHRKITLINVSREVYRILDFTRLVEKMTVVQKGEL